MIWWMIACGVLTAWSMWAAFWVRSRARRALRILEEEIRHPIMCERCHCVLRTDLTPPIASSPIGTVASLVAAGADIYRYQRMRTIAGNDASVEMRLEGSHDGQNWTEV